MHRINTAGNVGNRFTDGNPAVPTPATVVNDSWLNDVQEEICQTIENAGIVLLEGTQTQLRDAIEARIAHAFLVQRVHVVGEPGDAALENGSTKVTVGAPRACYWKGLTNDVFLRGSMNFMNSDLLGVDPNGLPAFHLPAGMRPVVDLQQQVGNQLLGINTDGSVWVSDAGASIHTLTRVDLEKFDIINNFRTDLFVGAGPFW
jgi:hypothetical protein